MAAACSIFASDVFFLRPTWSMLIDSPNQSARLTLKSTAKIWTWEYDLRDQRVTSTNMYSPVVIAP